MKFFTIACSILMFLPAFSDITTAPMKYLLISDD